jgi:hypothetical protein
VPIRPLLEAEEAFSSDDIPIIAQAFDQVLKAKGLVDRKDPVVLIIAKLTIQIALKGERDPQRIAQAVLAEISE